MTIILAPQFYAEANDLISAKEADGTYSPEMAEGFRMRVALIAARRDDFGLPIVQFYRNDIGFRWRNPVEFVDAELVHPQAVSA